MKATKKRLRWDARCASVFESLCAQMNAGVRMNVFINIVLVILVLLATASGIAKIMLMQQEVEFFGPYGFTNPILIVFGILQLIGVVLLLLPKIRIIGAFIISITFLISAAVLLMSGNIPMASITLSFVVLAGFVAKQSFNAKNT